MLVRKLQMEFVLHACPRIQVRFGEPAAGWLRLRKMR